MSAPDTRQPIFDPGMDVATVVFSHVQCVKTRVNLALVSKLWRDASKPAAAYPDRFDFDAFLYMNYWNTRTISLTIDMMDNDEALSLPYERVVGLLGETAGIYGKLREATLSYTASRGSVRLLKWARENNLDWGEVTCTSAARNGHLPALQYLHENGCPWGSGTCSSAASNGHLPVLQYLYENGCPLNSHACLQAAGNGHLSVLKYLYENGCPWDSFFTWQHAAYNKHWDCLQYLVDNKCPGWEKYAEKYAKHLR